MKFKNAFLVGIMTIAGLTSCLSEDLGGEDQATDKGTLVLDVDLLKPVSRAVSEVNDFPVAVLDASGKQVASYDRVADVPKKITLAVGNYTVTSHTPGAISKKMYAPYYAGSKETEILKGLDSEVEVICKMKNSKISVNYDDDFKSVFASWEITITDGSETALSFTNTDLTNTVYWYFGENGVAELVVNFRGVTKDGSTIAARNVLTKDQADESYDDDNELFSGGEALTLNFTPSESTDGKIVGININVDLTFEESDENVNVSVVDKPGFEEGGGNDPTPGPTPGGDDSSITLNLPQAMTVNATTDPALGNTYIKADNGIKSIVVKIRSNSEEMVSSVSDLNDNYGVDFLGGAEIVENNDVVSLFTDLNQPLSVPNQGDKEYTFPIGNFFGLLVFLSGEHSFDLVVTDMNGNKKSGTVTLTVQ